MGAKEAIPDARIVCWCWGQAAKMDLAAARMGVMAVEVCSRTAWKVAAAGAALVVVAQHEEEEEEVPAVGSGAVCSRSLGRTPPA